MTTLSKRASAQQQQWLRIIAGAVMNAAHAHPGSVVDEKFARGVAKRAVGTLSAQFADVLAVVAEPSGRASAEPRKPRPGAKHAGDLRQRGRSQLAGPSPLRPVIKQVAKLIRPAKMAGDAARVEALIEVMRIIDGVAKRQCS